MKVCLKAREKTPSNKQVITSLQVTSRHAFAGAEPSQRIFEGVFSLGYSADFPNAQEALAMSTMKQASLVCDAREALASIRALAQDISQSALATF